MTLALEMSNHHLVRHLYCTHIAFFIGTPLHLSLVKILFEDSVHGRLVEIRLTQRTVLLPFLLPLIKAAFAEDLVAVFALFRVEDKAQTYIAFEVSWGVVRGLCC